MDCIIVALVFAIQCLGLLSGNILTGKSTVQSSTHPGQPSRQAIDGNTGTYSQTSWESNPYWECDLGGYFNVTQISVTSGIPGEHLRSAIIEIATSPMDTCPEMDTNYTCGRWPDVQLHGGTITFNCTVHSAVRYVRIRREVTGYLFIAEVEAEGVPGIPPDQQQYDKFPWKKVTTLVKSFSVALINECAEMCYRNQPCVAISFSKNHKPYNCLLAADTSMTADADWVSCQVNACVKLPTCPSNG